MSGGKCALNFRNELIQSCLFIFSPQIMTGSMKVHGQALMSLVEPTRRNVGSLAMNVCSLSVAELLSHKGVQEV